jgi:hypothetical protein
MTTARPVEIGQNKLALPPSFAKYNFIHALTTPTEQQKVPGSNLSKSSTKDAKQQQQ